MTRTLLEAALDAEEAADEAADVSLFEDNAGGLWLFDILGNGYAGLEHVAAGSFIGDAAALYNGDTNGWTLSEASMDLCELSGCPGCEYAHEGVLTLCATYDATNNQIVLCLPLGAAPMKYIGITEAK